MQTDSIVWIGDCNANIARLNNGVVNCVVTSPPYFLQRSYGGNCAEMGRESNVGDYIRNLVALFAALKSKLHPDGSVWVNIGDTFANTMSAGMHHGQGVGHGRSIQFPDRPKDMGFSPKSLIGVPARFQVAMIDAGWICRDTIVWNKQAPKPESVKDRCTRSYEMVYRFVKNPTYYFNHQEALEKATTVDPKRNPKGVRNMRDIWDILPERKSDHPAPYPIELALRCLKLTSKPGDLIVDPFYGSGTTGRAARELGCHSIGCEIYKGYRKMWGDVEIYEDRDCA